VSDPLYGLLGALIVFIVGLGVALRAGSKWGYLIAAAGIYWAWWVLGQHSWSGIPGPPWP
jgi:hypothetical protein